MSFVTFNVLQVLLCHCLLLLVALISSLIACRPFLQRLANATEAVPEAEVVVVPVDSRARNPRNVAVNVEDARNLGNALENTFRPLIL